MLWEYYSLNTRLKLVNEPMEINKQQIEKKKVSKYMKTQNTKSVKTSKKSGNKSKKAAAKIAAPVEAKTIQVEVTPAPVVVNQVKRGRGRPALSSSQSIVNLADLIAALPPQSSILVPNPFVRSLVNLGINLKAMPYKANQKNLSQLTEKFRKTSSNVSVVNLNEPEQASA